MFPQLRTKIEEAKAKLEATLVSPISFVFNVFIVVVLTFR